MKAITNKIEEIRNLIEDYKAAEKAEEAILFIGNDEWVRLWNEETRLAKATKRTIKAFLKSLGFTVQFKDDAKFYIEPRIDAFYEAEQKYNEAIKVFYNTKYSIYIKAVETEE